jgi:hypothetical protein
VRWRSWATWNSRHDVMTWAGLFKRAGSPWNPWRAGTVACIAFPCKHVFSNESEGWQWETSGTRAVGQTERGKLGRSSRVPASVPIRSRFYFTALTGSLYFIFTHPCPWFLTTQLPLHMAQILSTLPPGYPAFLLCHQNLLSRRDSRQVGSHIFSFHFLIFPCRM